MIVVAALLMMTGCAADRPFAALGNDYRPQPSFRQSPPSLVIDAPAMRKNAPAGSQWYDQRNDYQRTTYAGLRSPIIDYAYTRVYDRQYSTSHHVHDQYSRETRLYRSVGTSQ